MPSLDLIASRAITVGKRSLAVGERFCRMDFASQADADFMQATLRWSAFRFVSVGDAGLEPAPALGAATSVPLEGTELKPGETGEASGPAAKPVKTPRAPKDRNKKPKD